MNKAIYRLCFTTVILAVAAALPAQAASHPFGASTTPENLPMGTKDCPYKQSSLGHCLTPWGAIKAGSPDGKIPAYTGGLSTPPPGADVDSGRYPDPFADEKPVLRIDHTNMAKYKDKLAPGVRYLMKRYPDFYINVYPTHRTARYPDYVIKGMLYNATHAKMDGKNHVVDASEPGFPFPIAKTGAEAQWNSNMRYRWPWQESEYETLVVDSSGHRTLLSHSRSYMRSAHNSPDWNGPKDANYALNQFTNAPAQSAGTALLEFNTTDYRKHNAITYAYNPGQRRVRQAPEISYDTPVAVSGGTIFGDEADTFAGSLSRYDWKLAGRKEMYIPYNDYKLKGTQHPIDKEMLKHYINPEMMRWELHRVWVLQLTLASGQRHVEPRKTIYIDEDTWHEALWNAWDASGHIFRMMIDPIMASYFPSRPNTYWAGEAIWDFSKNTWVFSGSTACKGCGFWLLSDPKPDYVLTPAYLKEHSFQ